MDDPGPDWPWWFKGLSDPPGPHNLEKRLRMYRAEQLLRNPRRVEVPAELIGTKP